MANTPRFSPNPQATFPFVAGAAILAMSCVIAGASDGEVLPAEEGSPAPLLGIAPYAIAEGKTGDVVTGGIATGVASGTITRGSFLVVGPDGTVAAADALTPARSPCIGIALESATDGQHFALFVAPQTFAGVGAVIERTAGSGGVTAGRAVIVLSNGKVGKPAGADPTSGVLGIAFNTAAENETAYIIVLGVAEVTASGNILAGANLAVAGTGGDVKTAAPAAGTNTFCVGTALEAISTGTAGLALVRPFSFQG